MTLEEVLPILKSGTPIVRQPWLDDLPYYFIQRKGLDNPALTDSAGYQYAFNNLEIFADDWMRSRHRQHKTLMLYRKTQ